MITLIFTISGEYFGDIDQDSNGEIDGQEATDAINYIIEHINQFYWMTSWPKLYEAGK